MTEKDKKQDFAYTGYNRRLVPNARELRKNMTKQERHLWYDFLNKYPVRFQRQKTIGCYIADFYCARVKLVIELDGSQHYTEEGMEHDAGRTAALETLGITVIRFTNAQIDKEFAAVCAEIDRVVKEKIAL